MTAFRVPVYLNAGPSTNRSLQYDRSVEELREALRAYLARRWSTPRLHVGEIAPFGDGHSGFTYAVELNGGELDGRHVLRVSPPTARLTGPADVGRQGRIMAALGRAGLPVPQVLAYDSAPVLDGRSFVLMVMIEGTTWEVPAAKHSHQLVAHRAIDVLHRLRELPLAATGIGDEVPVSPSDELDRWVPLLERSPGSLAEKGRPLIGALSNTLPAASPPGLVHGDFHYGNLLYDGSSSDDASVVAVVDWEIAEIGSPLLDLGALAAASLRRRYEPEPNPAGNLLISAAELVDYYGAAEDEAGWYIALSCFKYAAILGYNLQLHRRGRRVDPVYEELHETMHGLIEDGLAIAESGLAAVVGR